MAGDPFGLLLRQRIVFLGGEVTLTCCNYAEEDCWSLPKFAEAPPWMAANKVCGCAGQRLCCRCYHQPASPAGLSGLWQG